MNAEEVSHSPVSSAPAKDLISGQQLNLTCSLGVPLTSDLRLKWIPPQRSSLPPLQTRERLAIPAVAAGDGGKWRCELWRDDRLLTSAVITLKIGEGRKCVCVRECEGRKSNLALTLGSQQLYAASVPSLELVTEFLLLNRAPAERVDAGHHL